jgi:uncharacterized protein
VLLASACDGGDGQNGETTGGVTTTAPKDPGVPVVEGLEEILASVDIEPAQREYEAPRYTGSQGIQSMADFVKVVVEDVNAYWADRFAAGGVPYEPPGYVVVEQRDIVYSNCSDGTTPNAQARPNESAFYCPNGGQFGQEVRNTPVIYFTAPWLYNEFQAVNPQNFDFAVASVIAHEFGHHVQFLLLRSGITFDGVAPKWKELGADCLSGTWANAAYHEGQLQDTDIQEAMQAAWNAGSDLPLPENTPGDHGTRHERAAAFLFGYNTGDAMACFG